MYKVTGRRLLHFVFSYGKQKLYDCRIVSILIIILFTISILMKDSNIDLYFKRMHMLYISYHLFKGIVFYKYSDNVFF